MSPTPTNEPKSKRRGISPRARLGGSERPKRSPQALAASVLVHIVIAVATLQLLTFGHGLSGFLDFGKSKEQKEEKLTYVQTEPKKPEPKPVTKPVTPKVVSAAPQSIGVPSAPAEDPRAAPPPTRADTGSGAGTGTGNGIGVVDPNVRGIKPSYGDPRVWEGPVGNGVAPGRDRAEKLDSIMGYAIMAARDSLDSLARAQGRYGKGPGDWTKTDKNGNKWGWDPTGIRLGKVVIPNALLALLPLNAQKGMSGNFTELEREKRLGLARSDIQRMSERGAGEAEFRKIANDLRDRREKERRDRLRAPSASVAPAAASTTPPNKSDKNN